mmetsp:Transcript_17899/g.67490  ORF Transcript_17899/g.67490 Transcript_17899/m.67490 type:complete len:261 (-) Transcript_17899:145-927(-)
MGRRCGRDVRRLAGAPQPFRPTAVRRAVIGVFDAAGRAGILPSTGRLRSSGQFAWRGRVALARWRGAGLSVQMQTRPAPERSKAAVGARTPHTHDAVPGLRTLRVRAPPKLSSSQHAHALAVICRSRRAVAALQAGQRRVKVRNQLGYRPVELGHLPLLGQLPCCGGISNAFCLFFALMGELPALEQAGDRVRGEVGVDARWIERGEAHPRLDGRVQRLEGLGQHWQAGGQARRPFRATHKRPGHGVDCLHRRMLCGNEL